MSVHLIYCHTHRASGRRYIGRTKRPLLVRWSEHVREAREGRGCMPLREAIVADGPAAFDHEVLQECKSLEAALEAEMKWIRHHGTTDPAKGYNRIGSGSRAVMVFRDRIKGFCRLPAQRLEAETKNFRTHPASQLAALEGVLSDIGIAGAALVWVPDDEARESLYRTVDFNVWLASYHGSFRFIDGHARDRLIRDQPQPCLVVDCDEREAAELLATFDPVGALAGTDRAKYQALVGEFNSTNAAVQTFVADLAAVETKRRREATEAAGEEPKREEDPPAREDTPTPLDACPHCHRPW